jgi:hypothetical protein
MTTVATHLQTLLAERAQLADAISAHGVVRERPLVKRGETIATDLIANPLLRELRALDEQVIKLLTASGAQPADDALSEFEAAA